MKQSNDEVIGLLHKLQERLFAIDQKLNSFMNRSGAAPTPAKPPEKQHNHQHQKTMYPAICADCQKECTVPFKPTAERPVYCQECYSRRRSGQAPRPKEEPKLPDVIRAEDPIQAPAKKQKAAPKKTAAKKPPAKKKATVKKK